MIAVVEPLVGLVPAPDHLISKLGYGLARTAMMVASFQSLGPAEGRNYCDLLDCVLAWSL